MIFVWLARVDGYVADQEKQNGLGPRTVGAPDRAPVGAKLPGFGALLDLTFRR